jgi:hypothetical protein
MIPLILVPFGLFFAAIFYFIMSMFVGDVLFRLEYGGEPIGNFNFRWPYTLLKILWYKLKGDLNPCFECLVVPIALFYIGLIVIAYILLK